MKKDPIERILIYQHVPHEHAGRFADMTRDEGIQVDTVRFWESPEVPSHEKYTRLLIMGGPKSVYDSLEQYPSKNIEVDSIREFKRVHKPVLGVCLGCQLVAHAFGGNVYPHKLGGKPFKETGFYRVHLTERGKSDPLFEGFPESFEVFQWHGDVFDLPEGSTLLATDPHVRNQAFSYQSLTYGVLFHIEVTPQMVEELVRVDNEWLHKDDDVDERLIIEKAHKNERILRRLSERLFNNWLTLTG